MKRVIVSYKKLTPQILDLIFKTFPEGYNDSDIITFRDANDKLKEAIEVKTDKTIYLIKVSNKLDACLDSFADKS